MYMYINIRMTYNVIFSNVILLILLRRDCFCRLKKKIVEAVDSA